MLKPKTLKPDLFSLIKGNKIFYVPASHEDQKDPGALKKVLVSKGVIPDGAVQMINLAIIGPGKGFRPHFHEDMTEIFVVISGSGLMKVGSLRRKIGKDDLIIVHPYQIHEIKNTGRTEFKYLVFGVSKKGKGQTVLYKKRPSRRGVS
jgi:mannose-6-phosphate isomerase-like protein (cupin superfamily)